MLEVACSLGADLGGRRLLQTSSCFKLGEGVGGRGLGETWGSLKTRLGVEVGEKA